MILKFLKNKADNFDSFNMIKEADRIDRLMKKIAEGKRTIWILIGPPAVGKSTWARENVSSDAHIISRDSVVERIAEDMGWTYNDMFSAPPAGANVGDKDEKFGEVVRSPRWMNWQRLSWSKVLRANELVKKEMNDEIKKARESGKDIVVDMTNLSRSARASVLGWIKGLESDFNKVAVNFPFQGYQDVIKSISKIRAQRMKEEGKSKDIPGKVMDEMFGRWQAPDLNEGFDDIVEVDNREMLAEILRDSESEQ